MSDNEVLKATTEIKIHELERHEEKLSKSYDRIEQELTHVHGRDSHVDRLRTLRDGVKGLQVIQENVHEYLGGIDDLLSFGQIDLPSVSDVLTRRANVIEKEIQNRRLLWQHNKLLGLLLMESIDDSEKANQPIAGSEGGGGDENGEWELELDSNSTASPAEAAAKQSLEEQRKTAQHRIEEYFFTPCNQNRDNVREYLENSVFHRRDNYSDAQWRDITSILESVRAAVAAYSKSFTSKSVSPSDIATLAQTLLVSKSELSSDVVRLLENATQNAVVQQELAHVLTIKLSNLNEFEWPTKGIPVVMKRAINGRYRSLHQEDKITFLLFQYIGIQWSIFLKSELKMLLKILDVSRDAEHAKDSVVGTRYDLYDNAMLSALPDSVDEVAGAYDDETETEAAASVPTKMTKQDILRLVCTEAHLVNTLRDPKSHRSMVAVTTDMEFFGPSVSHEVVLGIMAFLGVTPEMLRVFETHMKLPLLFPGKNQASVLAKGVPVSRKTSLLYSELPLFVMDCAVMAKSGVFLFRTHDDIFFYGTEDDVVVAAWNELNEVASRFELRLNMAKSGSIRFWPGSTEEPATNISTSINTSTSFGPAPLPQKPIMWGLLELQSDATVQINEDKAQWFAMELAQKLRKTHSALRWITVYNKYMRFFLRNFGTVSPVFGLVHVDQMIDQIKSIHGIVFPATDGNVAMALRAKIESSHADTNRANWAKMMPAAWLHWPLDLGGLGLFNPLLELWSLKQALLQQRHNSYDPTLSKVLPPFHESQLLLTQVYDEFIQLVADRGLEDAINERFQNEDELSVTVQSSTKPERTAGWGGTKSWKIDDSFAVRPFQEYMDRQAAARDRMVWTVNSVTVVKYRLLQREFLAMLKPTEIKHHKSYSQACGYAKTEFGSMPFVADGYWIWVAYLFEDELENVFGSTSLVASELLPAQLIDQIKKAGIYWS